jgi:hypothetical protein
MVLKAAGLVIILINKLLIVGDSVMGCFVQAPGDGDASPDAVSYMVGIAFRVLRPDCERKNLAGRFADPFLAARRPVLP